MGKNLSNIRSLVLFELQQKFEQVFDILLNAFLQQDTFSLKLPFYILHILSRKRWIAVQHFIQQYAKTPDICLVIVLSSVNDFGRHILIGPAEAFPHFLRVMETRPAKVAELHFEILIQQNVFGLYISVKNFHPMKVLDRQRRLVSEPQG